jgi:hypothetical protein
MSNEIDLDYRPATYFRPQRLDRYLRSTVKGAVLRENMHRLFDGGGNTDLLGVLGPESLTAADCKAMERVHPMFMGGNYLPDTDAGEVEIARICIKSTTYDVTSVYAKPVEGAIHYRVVDEYDGETLLGEFADFFLGAWPLLDVLEYNFEGDQAASLNFFSVDSEFYPALDRLCRKRVIERFPAPEREDDTED